MKKTNTAIKVNKVYINNNGDRFLIVKDDMAGKPNKYTVIMWNCEKAKVIGRELSLTISRSLIMN